MIVGFANRTISWSRSSLQFLGNRECFLVFCRSGNSCYRAADSLQGTICCHSAAAGEKNKVKGLGFM